MGTSIGLLSTLHVSNHMEFSKLISKDQVSSNSFTRVLKTLKLLNRILMYSSHYIQSITPEMTKIPLSLSPTMKVIKKTKTIKFSNG